MNIKMIIIYILKKELSGVAIRFKTAHICSLKKTIAEIIGMAYV